MSSGISNPAGIGSAKLDAIWPSNVSSSISSSYSRTSRRFFLILGRLLKGWFWTWRSIQPDSRSYNYYYYYYYYTTTYLKFLYQVNNSSVTWTEWQGFALQVLLDPVKLYMLLIPVSPWSGPNKTLKEMAENLPAISFKIFLWPGKKEAQQGWNGGHVPSHRIQPGTFAQSALIAAILVLTGC